MFLEVKTIVTSKVPLSDDGFGAPEHSIVVEAEDEMPEQVIYAVALGAARTAAVTISKKHFPDTDTESKHE